MAVAPNKKYMRRCRWLSICVLVESGRKVCLRLRIYPINYKCIYDAGTEKKKVDTLVYIKATVLPIDPNSNVLKMTTMTPTKPYPRMAINSNMENSFEMLNTKPPTFSIPNSNSKMVIAFMHE